MRLQNKTIIVTGASSGIGAAAAKLFAAEGANLILGARRAERLEALASELEENRYSVETVVGDVGDEDFHKSLVETAVERYGGLDGAFNNAGITGSLAPLTDLKSHIWDEVIATNLTGAFLAARYQVPALQTRGSGSLLFTGSFVGVTVGLPGMAAYAASKAGLLGLVQVLAAETGADCVRVNALLPGGTKTPMAGDDPNALSAIAEMHALKRMAEPLEIAKAALFLISDEASFVTGSAFFADGGNSILKV